VSGVSLDEEMIRLIRLESAYQANARVISTIQGMLETLVQMV
jgi:flagellar hook-associated protein 1 FlgK